MLGKLKCLDEIKAKAWLVVAWMAISQAVCVSCSAKPTDSHHEKNAVNGSDSVSQDDVCNDGKTATLDPSAMSGNASADAKDFKPGEIVPEDVVGNTEVQSWFSVNEIDDSIFKRIWKKSFKENCTVPRSQLRYLRILHWNGDGLTQVGEMVCNKIIADKLIRVFKKLYDANYKIESVLLVDDFDADDVKSMNANNTTCFNFRFIKGTKKTSCHGKGLAVDLNPLYNPDVRTRNGKLIVNPEKGREYATNRKSRKDIPYKIDRNDLAYKIFKSEGFSWGGDWRSIKDYQHFEYNGK